MAGRRWSHIEEETAKRMIADGASYHDVAAHLGRTAIAVSRRCDDFWHLRPLRVWTPDEDRVAPTLLAEGMSYSEIGRRLNRHPDLVGRRNRDVWKVPRPKHVWLNEAFFDYWNPVMAYVLGFILADGCLKRDGRWVSITQMEKTILEDIARAIQHSGRIYQERRGAYRLEFRSERVWNRLHELGLVPAKSLVAVLPPVPREHLPHFVRGYFDGNGTVHVCDRGKKPMVFASIATGSDTLRVQLATAIGDELGIKCLFSRYALRVTSHKGSMRFLLWLYAEKDQSIYLKRKYDRFAYLMDRRIGWNGGARRPAQRIAG